MNFIEEGVAVVNTAAMQRPYEPMFDSVDVVDVQLPDRLGIAASIGTLGKAVRAHPADILNHVRRVLLARVLADRSELRAAFEDLDIASCDAGAKLRQQLASIIGSEYQDLLTRQVDTNEASGGFSASVLCAEPQAGLEFIQPATDTNIERTLEGSARQLVERGQSMEAKDLLEQSLLEDPDDVAAAELLLFVYRTDRDLDGFRQMQEALRRVAPNAAAFNPIWEGTEQYLQLIVTAPPLEDLDG